MNYYEVKVFIPDDHGGSYTFYGRYADTAQKAMDSVAEENPDIDVVTAILCDNL